MPRVSGCDRLAVMAECGVVLCVSGCGLCDQ